MERFRRKNAAKLDECWIRPQEIVIAPQNALYEKLGVMMNKTSRRQEGLFARILSRHAEINGDFAISDAPGQQKLRPAGRNQKLFRPAQCMVFFNRFRKGFGPLIIWCFLMLTCPPSATIAAGAAVDDQVCTDFRSCKMAPYLDGILVACQDRLGRVTLKYINAKSSQYEPIQINTLDEISDIQSGSSGTLLLGQSNSKIALKKWSQGGGIEDIETAVTMDTMAANTAAQCTPILINSNHPASIMIGESVWWLDSGWHHQSLPAVPGFPSDIKSIDGGAFV